MFILLTLLIQYIASSATLLSDTIFTATASTPTTSQLPTTTVVEKHGEKEIGGALGREKKSI
jgi:hypothetical protein